MREYSLAHVRDEKLLGQLAALIDQDRMNTASLLAHLAEVDARKLYVPAGHSSMFAFCIEELHMSEDAAYKRIRAARAARQFPELFEAIADGRVHLAGVYLLANHLTEANVSELIDVSTHRKKSEIEELFARRFPAPAGSVARHVSTVRVIPQLAPGPVGNTSGDGQLALGPVGETLNHDELALGPVDETLNRDELALGPVGEAPNPTPNEPRVPAGSNQVPSEPALERFLVKVAIERRTYDKLRQIQALLSHAIPSGDLAQLLDRSFDALLDKLQKRKVGALVSRPRTPRNIARSHSSRTRRTRHIPAQVRRAVWERDQGQCTFVGPTGRRCTSRRFLEFDHVEPLARGGKATVDGLRLRCRAHNQYAAEQAFGADFMNQKRAMARLEAAGRRAAVNGQIQDVVAGLRSLGCRVEEARRAADFSMTIEGTSLEERMRAALQYLSRRSGVRYGSSPQPSTPMARERAPRYGKGGVRRFRVERGSGWRARDHGTPGGSVGDAFTYANAARMAWYACTSFT